MSKLDDKAIEYCRDYGRSGVVNGADISAFKVGFKNCAAVAVGWITERIAYYHEHPEVNIVNDLENYLKDYDTH